MGKNKTAKLHKYLPLAVLPLVFAVVIGLWVNYLSPQETVTVYSVGGVWDLREMEFDGGHVFLLRGPVELVPGALLNPEEFVSREDEVILVNYYDDFATGRLRVLLPEDGWYTFARISASYNHRVFVNGEWLMDIGVPGACPETSVPEIDHMVFTARPIDGAVEIVQQVSNFVHRVPGWHDGFYVGRGHLLATTHFLEYDRSIAMGSFMSLFFVYTMLFFLLNRQKANLYFALFCLTWFIRFGVMNPSEPAPFTRMFPWLTWHMELRIEYISIPITAILAVAIIGSLFPGILQKYYRRAVYAVSTVFAASFIFADTLFMSAVLLDIMMGIFGAATLYIALRLIWKARKVNMAQGIFLVGAGLFLYFILAEFVSRLEIARLPLFMEIGMANIIVLIFTLCTAAAVFTATRAEAEATKNAMEAAKEAERRLAEENAAFDSLSRLKSNFLADISHEMKTPLTLMGGFADLTRWQIIEGVTSESTLENLATVADEANRLAGLVDKLLDLSSAKGGVTKGVRVFVPDIISRATALCQPILAAGENRLEIEIEKNCPPVYASPDMILQVLFNLVTNANRHTKKGVVKITVLADGDMVLFQVRDNGKGIPPELLDGVFQRGVSGDGSTGLGLAICKATVEASGGTIRVESEEPRIENERHGRKDGTVISFTLPIWQEGIENEC